MLYKAIEHGKEKRKKYYGSKAIDCSCRNHGDCEYCKGNRLYQFKKELAKCKDAYLEYAETF